jgi:hypothetical protein
MRRTIIAALLAAASLTASATDYWVVANTLSSHSVRECPACKGGEPNEFNWGGGIEARFKRDLAVQVGGYRNTYGHGTAYAIGIWQPLTDKRMSAGGFVGAATGYKSDPGCASDVCPIAGFLITVANERFGFNVMVVPALSNTHTNVFGLQLKVKLN